jgi:hypothetical protein
MLPVKASVEPVRRERAEPVRASASVEPVAAGRTAPAPVVSGRPALPAAAAELAAWAAPADSVLEAAVLEPAVLVGSAQVSAVAAEVVRVQELRCPARR